MRGRTRNGCPRTPSPPLPSWAVGTLLIVVIFKVTNHYGAAIWGIKKLVVLELRRENFKKSMESDLDASHHWGVTYYSLFFSYLSALNGAVSAVNDANSHPLQSYHTTVHWLNISVYGQFWIQIKFVVIQNKDWRHSFYFSSFTSAFVCWWFFSHKFLYLPQIFMKTFNDFDSEMKKKKKWK